MNTNDYTEEKCERCGNNMKFWEFAELPCCGDCLTDSESEEWFQSAKLDY